MYELFNTSFRSVQGRQPGEQEVVAACPASSSSSSSSSSPPSSFSFLLLLTHWTVIMDLPVKSLATAPSNLCDCVTVWLSPLPLSPQSLPQHLQPHLPLELLIPTSTAPNPTSQPHLPLELQIPTSTAPNPTSQLHLPVRAPNPYFTTTSPC